MKIRSNYVSNSSSSSFIIAYDPLFFGNIKAFFKEFDFGCETEICNENDFLKSMPEYKEEIDKIKTEGKQVLCFRLDHEFYSIVELLKMINESNGGNKLKIIFDGDFE